MGLLYNIRHWLDHVTEYPGRRRMTENGDGTVNLERAEGETLQQGTARNAANYNNLETGVLAAQLQALVLEQHGLQMQRAIDDLTGEYGLATLSNGQAYPFNSSGVTIPLSVTRSSLDYQVQVEVTAFSGGMVEAVEVYDKQKNGFKIRFKGAAKSVMVKYCITGGRYS